MHSENQQLFHLIDESLGIDLMVRNVWPELIQTFSLKNLVSSKYVHCNERYTLGQLGFDLLNT